MRHLVLMGWFRVRSFLFFKVLCQSEVDRSQKVALEFFTLSFVFPGVYGK